MNIQDRLAKKDTAGNAYCLPHKGAALLHDFSPFQALSMLR